VPCQYSKIRFRLSVFLALLLLKICPGGRARFKSCQGLRLACRCGAIVLRVGARAQGHAGTLDLKQLSPLGDGAEESIIAREHTIATNWMSRVLFSPFSNNYP